MVSNIKSSDSHLVASMRWAARILSICWAFWALFWTLFVLGHLVGAGGILGIAAFTFACLAFPPMTIGAALAACVWRKEELGGKVLLVDGILMLALVAWVFDPHSAWVAVTGFWTMVVPTMAAGALFLTCHWMSTERQSLGETRTADRRTSDSPS